jgi:hypothetical protein
MISISKSVRVANRPSPIIDLIEARGKVSPIHS